MTQLGSASRPLQVIAFAGVPGTLLVMLAPRVGVTPLLVGAVVLGVATSLWNVATTLIVFGYVSPTVTGRSTARIFVGFCVGMMTGPVVFGLVVDRLGDWTIGWGSLLAWQLVLVVLSRPLRGWRSGGRTA
ncbi:MAG: hypothetical protein GEV28_40930 [Actinophytocola sp.]|uniref:hypothetical protein n=1 Tax=Actinophytocola sp. TaxID=1872138 RepID=UPI001329421E|nr:hypothetical protein [Actinophytocola sp.]MPZ86401.1 hypothetical protein [Actinophytocola sp.]